MSAPHYITLVDLSGHSILLTDDTSPISRAVISQLKKYSSLALTVSPFPVPHHPPPSAIIHFAGFSSSPLANQTDFNSHLHELLLYCHTHPTKLVFVVPANYTALKHSAEMALLRFATESPLNYLVISLDSSAPLSQSAAQVVSRLVYGHRSPPPSSPPQPPPPPPVPVTRSHFSPWLLVPLLLVLPYFLVFLQILALSYTINCAVSSYTSDRLSATAACLHASQSLAQLLTPQIHYLPGMTTFAVFRGYPPATSLNLLTAFSLHVDALSQYAASVAASPPQLLDPSLPAESVDEFQSALKSFYQSSSHPPSYVFSLALRLESLHAFFSRLSDVSSSSPDFFPDGPINYLFLLQDSSELRPSGGFLDSFYVVTLDSGRITRVRSFTAAQADSQLKGQVSPPPALATALNENQWLLRDANWDPDFPTAANRIAWFVNKELSLPVSVVVATNTTIFPQLLAVFGPQHLTASASPVTSANFYSQYFSHLSLTASSSPFLLNLADSLARTHPRPTAAQMADLLLIFAQDLADRQILISPVSFSSPALTAGGWTGALLPSPCSSPLPCISDYYYPVFSNVGINKADRFISRAREISLQFSASLLTTTARLSLTNHSLASAPGGSYKNYFRLYLPLAAQIDSLSLDGHPLTKSAYTQSFDHGLLLLSLLDQIPPSGQSVLAVTYHQPLNSTAPFHYQLDLPPQPGLSLSSSLVTVNYPPSWQVISYNDSANPTAPVASPGRLRYNTPDASLSRLNLDITPSP